MSRARVENLVTRVALSYLRSSAVAGATSLNIESGADFRDEGGQIIVSMPLSDPPTYSEPLVYTARTLIDENIAPDANTEALSDRYAVLSLAEPLALDLPLGTEVQVYPQSEEKWVQARPTEPGFQESVWARVPHSLMPLLSTEGIRPVGLYEQVNIDKDEYGVLTVTEVYGLPAMISSSFVEDLNNPLQPTAPPEVSPALNVTGTADALLVRATDFPVGQRIQYHISTQEGFELTPDTLWDETQSTFVAIKALPNNDPLVLGTVYYVKALAVNDLGAAPAPSAEVPASLDASAVKSIASAEAALGFILTGGIDVGGRITIDPDRGIEVDSVAGTTRFPTDGSSPYIAGEVHATGLEIEGNLSINGSGRLNGDVGLKAGISAPPLPPLFPDKEWPKVVLSAMGDGTKDNGFIYNGMSADMADPNRSVTAIAFLGGGIRVFDHRTGWNAFSPDLTYGKTWAMNFDCFGGIATDLDKGVYYVMGRDRNRSSNWYVYAIHGQTFNQVGEFIFWNDNSVSGAYPKISYYGGALWIAWVHDDNNLHLRKVFTAGNSSAVTFSNTSGTAPADANLGPVARQPIGDVEVGTFDSPTNTPHVVVTYADTGSYFVWALNTATCTVSSSSELAYWLKPAKVRGFRWVPAGTVAGKFVDFDNFGNCHHFGKTRKNTLMRATESWYDPQSNTLAWDAADGAGTHETDESPYVETLVQARSWITAVTRQAPDEGNFDTSNTDKANATRVYIGVGSGTRNLQQTLGKSSRSITVAMSAVSGAFGELDATKWLKAFDTEGLYTFTAEDIGASVTGTTIPAGTTIADVPAEYGGQVAVLSQAHTTTTPINRNVTVTRAVYSHSMRPLPELLAGGKTPPTSNGFVTAKITPGILKSVAEDTEGSLVKMSGDGSWRLGLLKGTAAGELAAKPLSIWLVSAHNIASGQWWKLSSFTTPTPSKVWSKDAATQTSGKFTFTRAGVYEIVIDLAWPFSSATGERALYVTFNTTDGPAGAGDTDYRHFRADIPPGPGFPQITVTHKVVAAANDYFTIFGYQSSGASNNVGGYIGSGVSIEYKGVW